MADDILVWLRDEERRLRAKVGAVHGNSPQYHSLASNNQADKIARAAAELERLRALVDDLPERQDNDDVN